MTTPRRTIPSQGEFVVLIAMMFACIAFSIDAILPALARYWRKPEPR